MIVTCVDTPAALSKHHTYMTLWNGVGWCCAWKEYHQMCSEFEQLSYATNSSGYIANVVNIIFNREEHDDDIVLLF